jgi:glycosyltransferase involved in cell wall biosynthesis
MKNRPQLSVVVPLYNEEGCVVPLHASLVEVCDQVASSYELIFVDDGSDDQTFPMLKLLYARNPRVKVIRFRRNCGQTAAMNAGFRYAKGEVIISMDGDLQNDPRDIPRLLEKIEEGYDIVCGWRKSRRDKLISRKIPSILANRLIGYLTGVKIHDNGCSLKAYRTHVIKRVPLYSEMHRFIPAMATLTGAKITEIATAHHARRSGKSKYGLSRIWKVSLDLVLIKMLTTFAEKPALWFSMLSIPSFLLGMVCLAGLIVSAPSTIVLPTLTFLFFALSTHFQTMGLLGEMALRSGDFRPGRLLAAINERPDPIRPELAHESQS